MSLLGGGEHRVVRGKWERRGKEGGRELSKKEIRRAIRKLKDGKVAGYDGIPEEVWKYGGKELIDWGWNYCNKVWKGERWGGRKG